MSGDEERWTNLFMSDNTLPRVTAEGVADKLQGFRLPLLPGRDVVWLADSVRDALALATDNIEDGPHRTPDIKVRGELDQLAKSAEETWLKLFERTAAADRRLWNEAWRRWAVDVATDDWEGMTPDYRRLRSVIDEIAWAAGFLRDTARAINVKRGPQSAPDAKRTRVERGVMLAPVFEAAFGKRPTANNYPDRSRSMTPFMDFYERMVTLAYDGHEASNLSDVVKRACREYRKRLAG